MNVRKYLQIMVKIERTKACIHCRTGVFTPIMSSFEDKLMKNRGIYPFLKS
jgi:hypothetical protein